MDPFDAINRRRSVKAFDPGHRFTPAEENRLLEAAIRSPTSPAAKAMGYDSCPMIGFDPVKVAEIIALPGDHVIAFMIAVGRATKPAWPKGRQLSLSEVVVQDRSA